MGVLTRSYPSARPFSTQLRSPISSRGFKREALPCMKQVSALFWEASETHREAAASLLTTSRPRFSGAWCRGYKTPNWMNLTITKPPFSCWLSLTTWAVMSQVLRLLSCSDFYTSRWALLSPWKQLYAVESEGKPLKWHRPGILLGD